MNTLFVSEILRAKLNQLEGNNITEFNKQRKQYNGFFVYM